MSARDAARSGGLAAWAIGHPIGVSMIALAVVILGLFALGRLAVDLLPHIIYPEIVVRVADPGVPSQIMEERVTRQLEEQLAITEDATGVKSRSGNGSSVVELSFEYGKDIDIALRDASTRLDRAKRFLPDSIDPPVIFKRDPSQIPVLEFVVSSSLRDGITLRDWVDYDFSTHFLNLPGVSAVEVGGGLRREIQVLPDQQRLAAVGLTVSDVVEAVQRGNVDSPGGRLVMPRREISGRTAARFDTVADIAGLPLTIANGDIIRLDDVARVQDTHKDERIRVRLDGRPGVKVSIQKQPAANTVSVVEAVNERLQWLQEQALIPEDIAIRTVSDQAIYVRNALSNASLAALSGTLLAMAVIYLFLGNLRRTLIIGSAIPLAVMVTFVLMGMADLTFNIMTLGGLALGIGMLVDNTIVMLENIYRHQRKGEPGPEAGRAAAREINGAIVAATSTNLAAVLPFLFVGGLVGLLFRELIFTISAAILASMVVALTLVPALASRVHSAGTNRVRERIDGAVGVLQRGYGAAVRTLLTRRWLQGLLVLSLAAAMALSLPVFLSSRQQFLPPMDDGQVMVRLTADPGFALEEMDRSVYELERFFGELPEVVNVFSVIGGSIFGRTETESSNRTTMTVQLIPRAQRPYSVDEWIKRMQRQVDAMEMAGMRVRMYTRGIRGIRLGSSDDDMSIRVQGPDLVTLKRLGDEIVEQLAEVPGLRNAKHSAEEVSQELTVVIDRQRAALLKLDAEDVGRSLRRALDGEVVTEFFDHDRAYEVRLRLPRHDVDTPHALEQLVLFTDATGRPLRLTDVGRVRLAASPAEIWRDNQRRIVEVTASVGEDITLEEAFLRLHARLADFELPPGYAIFDGGELKTLQEGRAASQMLLALAIFLVFVVMAVQYESLRNPLVILLSIPFAAIGVALGLTLTDLPLSMPVWLGMIMLAGIVVNNAIVLVEYIEIGRARGLARDEAIVEAARLRLRPILMTTLTTTIGMLPLALGLGEGAEMLQPLAVSIISGLSVSLLITLALIPLVYRLFHPLPPATAQ